MIICFINIHIVKHEIEVFLLYKPKHYIYYYYEKSIIKKNTATSQGHAIGFDKYFPCC